MLRRTNVPDLIHVLCGLRPEHSHERLIALATFVAWLHWPEGPEMVDDARAVACALVIRGLLQNKIDPIDNQQNDIDGVIKRYLVPEVISKVLLDRVYQQEPLYVEYSLLEEEHKLACATAEFLMRAPRLPRPSLNRCRFFIAKGGFAPPLAATEICPPRAISTTKKAWFHYGAVSPFLLAARLAKIPIVDLAPDDKRALPKLIRFSDQDFLRSYFEIAKSIQSRLASSLDSLAERKVAFIQFPDQLSLGEVNFDDFSPQQARLLRTYSVENATKIRLR